MRPRGTWLLTALVVLFLAEGQRAWVASLLVLPAHGGAGAALLAALLPVPVLVAPLLPLGKVADRRTLVAVAAIGTAVGRLAMMHPALFVRAAAGTVVVMSALLFLSWAVGRAEQRGLAAGLVLGLTVDQLLRLAGSSYDLSLQPVWVPVQVLLSLALVACALYWRHAIEPPVESGGLERRGAGLRLRSAIALGPLLFLDLHVLGLPPVIAQWGGIEYGLATLLSACAAATALGLTLASGGALRGRNRVVALSSLVAVAPLLGWWLGGAAAGVVAGVMAAGHGAALMLMARALDPASGRRSGRVVSATIGIFLILTVLYSATAGELDWLPLGGGTVWVLASAGVLLLGSGLLLPQPLPRDPLLRPIAAAGAGAGVLIAALLIPLLTMEPAGTEGTGSLEVSQLRVGLFDVDHGFGPAGRFDPGAAADTIAAADPDMLALEDAPVGLPAAYGVDLPRWLARRLGLTVVRRQAGPGTGLPESAGRRLLLRPGLMLPGEGTANVDESASSALRVAGQRVWIHAGHGSSTAAAAEGDLVAYLPMQRSGWSQEDQQALSRAGLQPLGAVDARHAIWAAGLRAAGPITVEGPVDRPRLLVVPLQPVARPVRSLKQ